MFMPMQQPIPYPFYMGRQPSPTPLAWSSTPFNLHSLHQPQVPFSSNLIPQPVSPFILRRPRGKPHSRNLPTSASFSNTRYHHLKQSASYSSRRPMHHSVDAAMRPRRYSSQNHFYPPQQARLDKARSTSEFDRLSQSTHLSRAQSCQTMASHRSSNLSVSYAKEERLTPKRRRKHSPQKQPRLQPPRHPSLSPKRRASFNQHRKRPINLPERGVVRISTLDEMPLPASRNLSRTNSINNDRLSTNGSISKSSNHRTRPTEKIKTNRMVRNNDEEDEGPHVDSDTQSSLSSSSANYSTLQHRLNGSLRNDPMISAAMEEFRQFRQSYTQTPSTTSHRRDLSRDSLCPNSISHSSSSSSSSSRNSQSSFTSVERSEIRHVIKTMKIKPATSTRPPPESAPIPIPIPISLSTSASEQSLSMNTPPPLPSSKPRKSSITEELDREFSKLRSLDPNQEISFVTPSSICKRKVKTLEKPPPEVITPVSTFDELLRKVQLRPIDRSVKPLPKKEKILVEDSYENSLLSIPVPRSSPIPVKEIQIEEAKHEYAIPVKKSEGKLFPQVSHFQPSLRSRLTRPFSTTGPERRMSRSLSILNRFQQGFTNPFPTTFQPDRTAYKQTDYEPSTSSAKENIYTSDVDVYVPLSNSEKVDDQALQIHLENQTILTDDFYSEYTTKEKLNSSSILKDFSHLFARKHKHQKKDQRCSIM